MSDLPELEFAQRIEGSLAVVPHPQEPDIYGTGNLEVEGTLRINDVKSNKDDVIVLHDPLDLTVVERTGQHPVEVGTLRIFADKETNKLATVDDTGTLTVLNPLKDFGDIMVYGLNGPERLPKGSAGQVLSVNAAGLPSWTNVSGSSPSGPAQETTTSVYGSNFMYKEEKSEKIATNKVFVSHLALRTTTLPPGVYVVRVQFDWNMVDASSGLQVQFKMNEEILAADEYHVHSVDEYRHVMWSMVLTKTSFTDLSFSLQMQCTKDRSAYKCKSLYIEVYRVA